MSEPARWHITTRDVHRNQPMTGAQAWLDLDLEWLQRVSLSGRERSNIAMGMFDVVDQGWRKLRLGICHGLLVDHDRAIPLIERLGEFERSGFAVLSQACEQFGYPTRYVVGHVDRCR